MNIGILAVAMAAGTAAASDSAAVLSQAEVDRLVDAKALACVHQEDFEAEESSLRRRGATYAMLAHGYCEVMKRTKDAPLRTPYAERFQASMAGFMSVAVDGQLTNLLSIASTATNQHSVADAIAAYHRRDPLSLPLLDWCIGRVGDAGVHELVKSTIWNCLRRTLKDRHAQLTLKARILEAARKGLSADPSTVFAADRILEENDPAYGRSTLRRRALQRMFETDAVYCTSAWNPVSQSYERTWQLGMARLASRRTASEARQANKRCISVGHSWA